MMDLCSVPGAGSSAAGSAAEKPCAYLFEPLLYQCGFNVPILLSGITVVVEVLPLLQMLNQGLAGAATIFQTEMFM